MGLLTEESVDDLTRLKKDYFWCVDPLDGTLPFIESTPGYAVSIALVSRSGIPQIGVIYDPVEQNLYYAIKGGGAFKNGEPFVIANDSDILTVIFDRSFLQSDLYDKSITILDEIKIKMGCKQLNIIKHGGAVMNAIWVLQNAPACYFKLPKIKLGGGSLWDFAATACIFRELTGSVSDINGANLDLNREDSTFMNHRGVLYTSNNELNELLVKKLALFV